MGPYRNQIEILFDHVFANLGIGPDKNRVAFHTIYGSHGWSLASNYSYTISSGSDIIRAYTNDIYDGISYYFAQPTLFGDVKTNLIDPADRNYAPNIIMVIWDGDTTIADAGSVCNLGRCVCLDEKFTQLSLKWLAHDNDEDCFFPKSDVDVFYIIIFFFEECLFHMKYF